MNARRLAFTSIVCIAACSFAVAAWPDSPEWVCTGKYVVGYSFDKGTQTWVPTHFKTVKYIVKKPIKSADSPPIIADASLAVYEFKKPNADPAFACKDDFNSVGNLFCEGLTNWFAQFKFNKLNGRFIDFADGGYITAQQFASGAYPEAEGSYTPYMEIGTCTAPE